MLEAVLRRHLAPALAIAVLADAIVGPTRAQTDDDHAELNARVEELREARKYAEALPLAERVVKLAEEKHGPDDPAVAGPLRSLARLYRLQDRYEEAEPLLKRSLAIREKP